MDNSFAARDIDDANQLICAGALGRGSPRGRLADNDIGLDWELAKFEATGFVIPCPFTCETLTTFSLLYICPQLSGVGSGRIRDQGPEGISDKSNNRDLVPYRRRVKNGPNIIGLTIVKTIYRAISR